MSIRNVLLGGICLLWLCCSCREGCVESEEAREICMKAGGRASDLKRVLEHCRGNREKFGAADFLISNLSGKYFLDDSGYCKAYHCYLDSIEIAENRHLASYEIHPFRIAHRQAFATVWDYRIIRADSLIKDIELACEGWRHTPWSHHYTREQFYEYILPYRVGNEPLNFTWREYFREKYRKISGLPLTWDVARICDCMRQMVDVEFNWNFSGLPLQDFRSLVDYKRGKCDDISNLVVMAGRALGIPMTFDFTPCWGDRDLGHSWNALIDTSGSTIPFTVLRDDVLGGLLRDKPVKIYRKTFKVQRDCPVYERIGKEEIPEFFAGCDFVDVTSEYGVATGNFLVELQEIAEQNHLAYLGVFCYGGWQPVAYGKIRNRQALFEGVGCGIIPGREGLESGEHTGEGILYMPLLYQEGESVPAGWPVIYSNDRQTHVLEPDLLNKQDVYLYRKYPRRNRVVRFAAQMMDGIFEGSNDLDFAACDELHYVSEIPLSRMQRVEVEVSRKYRYIRFRKQKGNLCLGELKFYGENGRELKGIPLLYPEMEGINASALFDSDVLTFTDLGHFPGGWMGIDFQKPERIKAIEYCPRTDGNDICPGDCYELFYWNGRWCSLGRQVADDYSITFRQVPQNALLWLRDLTKGKEERPFTWRDGVQVWW